MLFVRVGTQAPDSPALTERHPNCSFSSLPLSVCRRTGPVHPQTFAYQKTRANTLWVQRYGGGTTTTGWSRKGIHYDPGTGLDGSRPGRAERTRILGNLRTGICMLCVEDSLMNHSLYTDGCERTSS